jgi:glucokinase
MLLNQTFLGIEIGGTKLQIVTGAADGVLVTKHHFKIKKEDGAKGIRKNIEKTVHENYSERITATGIGFGGPVNWQNGQIAASFHIDGWSDFNIVDWLEPIVHAPVFVDNDANVAALGEALLGAGKEYRVVLYITIGSGVGGGLVINQQIYHGAIPGEIEIGHLRMDRSGDSFQSRCSGWAVDEKIRTAIAKQPKGLLASLVGSQSSGEAAFLKPALEQNDPLAREIFEETTDDLAFGISHAIHLLHPEIVILGGGFSLMGETLEKTVARKIPNYLMKAFQPGPVIKLALLREQSVPIGSLLLAHQNYHQTKKT